MKKLLLGLVVAGAMSASAFAETCTGGIITGATPDQASANTQSATGTTNTLAANQATGGVVNNIAGSAVTASGSVNAQMGALRLNTTDAMAAVAANGYNCGWLIWANPFGVWSKLDSSGGDVGYDLDVYGINVGLTKYFTDSFSMGIATGYAYSDVDLKGAYGSFNTDNWNVALYANYARNNWFGEAAVGYMWTWYNDYKAIGVGGVHAKAGDFDGDSWFTHLKVGYNFDFCSWIVTPSVAWNYVHTDVDAYTLHAAGVNVGRVSSSSNYSSTLPVMLRVAKAFNPGQLYVQAGYIREFHDDGGSGSIYDPTSATYAWSTGRDLAQNYGTVGAGWLGTWNRFNYGLTYDYTWATDYDSHNVNAYLGFKF